MMHNKNRNNRRFSKNNNFKKRRFGGGGHIEDEQQISPQQRRNFENKRDQHLMKAKEYLAAGERIDAENHFQHAEHYHRMANLGLDKIQQQQQQQQNFDNQQEGVQAEENYSDSQPENIADDNIPEIPVDMMGRFPSERSEGGRNERNDRSSNRGPNRHQQPRHQHQQNRERNEQSADQPHHDNGGQPTNDLAALPFMQAPIKEA